MSEHKRRNSKISKNTITIASLAYLVLGLVMVIFPEDVKKFFCFALGTALTVYGLFNLFSFFTDKDNKAMLFELIVGIFSTALGIFSFTVGSPFDIIIKIIGVIIVIDSIMDIKYSFELKKYGAKHWLISVLVSIAVIIFACFILFFTDLFKDFIIVILGLILIYEGISGLVMKFILARFEKAYRRNDRMIEAEATSID